MSGQPASGRGAGEGCGGGAVPGADGLAFRMWYDDEDDGDGEGEDGGHGNDQGGPGVLGLRVVSSRRRPDSRDQPCPARLWHHVSSGPATKPSSRPLEFQTLASPEH